MKKKQTIKNILFSMRTAIILLVLLTVACVVGSVLPQGELEAYYTGYYSGALSHLILLLNLDDVFHSVWFTVLTILLCLNLLGCNLIRFPVLFRQMKEEYTPERRLAKWNGEADAVLEKEPEILFRRLHFQKTETVKTADQETCRYGVRNKFGIWGAWLTHLGMLIIIVGFALGQMFTQKYTVYGVVGESLPVEGTHYTVTIDDFKTLLREDETVDQYIANLTLTDTDSGNAVSGEASVNHPMNALGMKLYQNSTGWAANVVVSRGGELVQSEILCAGEHMSIKDMPDLVLAFNAFYPDYVMADGKPATASSELKNPGYLYTVYYQGDVLGMNVLTGNQPITIDDLTIVFMDPQPYTLIQLKRDPFTGIALVGGILILAALFLSFYLRTEELWAVEQTDGTWKIAGYSRKGGVLFHERIVDEAAELNKEEKNGH